MDRRRLVNRSDVYRVYKLPHNRYLGEPITYTKPYLEEAREFGSLTRGIVEGHYRCGDPVELIGLHAVSFDNTARWFVINVDQKDATGLSLPRPTPTLRSAGVKTCKHWAFTRSCSMPTVQVATTCWSASPRLFRRRWSMSLSRTSCRTTRTTASYRLPKYIQASPR